MLVTISPKLNMPSFMGYLKGKNSLMIFDKSFNLRCNFGNRKFCCEGYFVNTIGQNEATIRKYIQQQKKYDIRQDKLTKTPSRGRQRGKWTELEQRENQCYIGASK